MYHTSIISYFGSLSMPSSQNNRFYFFFAFGGDFLKGNTLPLLRKIYNMPGQNNTINKTGTQLGVDNNIFLAVWKEKETKQTSTFVPGAV